MLRRISTSVFPRQYLWLFSRKDPYLYIVSCYYSFVEEIISWRPCNLAVTSTTKYYATKLFLHIYLYNRTPLIITCGEGWSEKFQQQKLMDQCEKVAKSPQYQDVKILEHTNNFIRCHNLIEIWSLQNLYIFALFYKLQNFIIT